MGESTPKLNKLAFAYLFDRENFLARLNDRAANLWNDDYSVIPHLVQPGVFYVRRNDMEGCGYLVDLLQKTCECPFYAFQEDAPLDLRPVACKHLRGLPALIEYQLAYLKMRWETATANRRERDAAILGREYILLETEWRKTCDELEAAEYDEQQANAEHPRNGCDYEEHWSPVAA